MKGALSITMDIKAALKKIPGKIRKIPAALSQFIIEYQESYHKGVEKFGHW
jgi:hypothetical protein